MNRRQFVVTTVGFIGGVILGPTTAWASQMSSPTETSGIGLEEWLLTTGKPEFDPTISALVVGQTTKMFFPMVRR